MFPISYCTKRQRNSPARKTWFHGLMCAALAALASAGLGGCGKDDGPRQFHVQGTVNYDGQPLTSGRITFTPDSTRGNAGPVGYAIIQDGKFDTHAVGGQASISGPLTVYITGFDSSGREDEEAKPPLFEDYKASAEIDPKQRSTTLNFDVPLQRK